jgi:hypothetical protein
LRADVSLLPHHDTHLNTVDCVLRDLKQQSIQGIQATWRAQGAAGTAAQLQALGEANAAALFVQLGPQAVAELLRTCGTQDFASDLFLALSPEFAGALCGGAAARCEQADEGAAGCVLAVCTTRAPPSPPSTHHRRPAAQCWRGVQRGPV